MTATSIHDPDGHYRSQSVDGAHTGQAEGPHGYFLFIFGVFGFCHWISYAFEWSQATLLTHAIGLAGLALALFPFSRPALIFLVGALAIDAVLQAPMFSNHTMLKNFLLLGMLAAGLQTIISQDDWASFMQRIALCGRWLLIGMYFFGVLHKVNTDFLDPENSCATALWLAMPFPSIITESTFIHITGIWATFIVEGAIVALLIWRRTRHLGIFFGIGFHALLALSGYAFYATFSTLTIALHCLFLPPLAHRRISEHPLFTRALSWLRTPAGWAVIALVTVVLAGYAAIGMYIATALGWLLLIIIPFAVMVLKTGRDRTDGERSDPALPLRPAWVPLLGVLFLFNGFTPYLGLKTAQSFNMFANLHLEDGRSNHLIFSNPPGPYGYLEDLVEITYSSGVPWFAYIRSQDLRIVYYDLLNHMERAGDGAIVSFRRGLESHERVTRQDLEEEFDRILHPRWFRAWFHFTPVDLTEPKPCALNR